MRGSTVLRYLFEGFSLDTDRRELWRDNAAVPVEPQVFDLLAYLVRHRDRVVSRPRPTSSAARATRRSPNAKRRTA